MKFENTEVYGFRNALRGMRNPMNSWGKSDSIFGNEECQITIGTNDMKLAQQLIKAGSEHRKFMRQIFVSVDITAPLYWWKEFDQYKIGTTTNSCSTMHKLATTPITIDCFECEDMEGFYKNVKQERNPINENTEVWKEHPIYNLYIISNQGRIKRKGYYTTHDRYWKERILKNIEHDDNYLCVNILLEEGTTRRKVIPVHRLVAETFIPNLENKPEVNHINGNKMWNTVDNLEWSTLSENEQHSHNNKLQIMCNNKTAQNISLANRKFNDEEIQEIIEFYNENNCSYRELAKQFDTSHTTVREIVLGTYGNKVELSEFEKFKEIISYCEDLRIKYLDTKNKKYWKALIEVLPESWLQTRTVTMSYENLLAMCSKGQRRFHKLNEWSGQDDNTKPNFISWARTLPYAQELIFIDEVEE